MTTRNPECQKRYKAYKNFCPPNVFVYSEMAKLKDNAPFNELMALLKDISEKKEVLQKCYALRYDYSKKCYSYIDEGHQKHFKVLDDHIKKFEDHIRQLNRTIHHRTMMSKPPPVSAWVKKGGAKPRKSKKVSKKTKKKSLGRRK